MVNDIPNWAKNIQDSLDSIENKLDSLITGQAEVNETPKRKVTPAITARLKNVITTTEGKILFQHMTRGPDTDWNKKRDIGLIVKQEDLLAKVISNVNTKNQITIEVFAKVNDKGEEEDIPSEKKVVSNDSLTVPSLWKFDLLEDVLNESLDKDKKDSKSITKAPADLKIKLKINHIWGKVIGNNEKYEKEKKWLRKWVDGRTLDQSKEDAPVKPAPKKVGGKKAKAAPKKAAAKKENPADSDSNVESSEDED